MNTIIGGLLKWADIVSSIPNYPKFVEPYGALCHGQDRSLGMVFPTAGSSTVLSFFFGFPWWDNSNGRNRRIPQNRVGSQRDF